MMKRTATAFWAGLCLFALNTLACSPQAAENWPAPPQTPVVEAPVEPHRIPLGPWDKPGLEIQIQSLGGASEARGVFMPGDYISVTFQVLDDVGKPYRLDELDTLDFIISGPTERFQPLFIKGEVSDILDRAIHLGKGRYRYEFTQPIPENYRAPYHDTQILGPEVGEAQGQPLKPGTYALLHQAFIHWPTDDPRGLSDEDDGLTFFTIGTQETQNFRQRYDKNACHRCHTVGPEPHTQQADAATCAVCHTPGAEDGGSEIDSSKTPGFTLEMGTFFHKLHMGENLSQLPLEVYGAPSEVEPYGQYYDFSFIQFPMRPGGVENCEVCHSDAADPVWKSGASRAACGSCHDWIDWNNPLHHPEGGPQLDDSQCNECHAAAGPSSILAVHQVPQKDGDLNGGVQLKIQGIQGASGPDGAFQVGDRLTLTLRIQDDGGAPLPLERLDEAFIVLSGPDDHIQPVFKATDLPPLLTTAHRHEDNENLYIYTLPPLPAHFAAPYHDSPAFDGSDGEWQGQNLVAGRYFVGAFANLSFQDIDENWHKAASPAHLREIQVIDGNTAKSAPIIDPSRCADCHGQVLYHEGRMEGVEGCRLCHTVGMEDFPSEEGPAWELEFSSLIHKIHQGQGLTAPFAPRGSETVVHFDGLFPAWPDRTRQCQRCHLDGTSDQSTARACLSCHDDPAAQAHALANTAGDQESCDICHGPDKDQAVGKSHGQY